MKLAPKYFGPFKVLEKIGKVAYKLLLPPGSKVHHTFHVSQLKKHFGNKPSTAQLPVLADDVTIVKEPVMVLDRRIVKKANRAVIEVLIQWTNSFPKDASWEVLHNLQQRFPTFNP